VKKNKKLESLRNSIVFYKIYAWLFLILSIEENTRLNTELLTRIEHHIDVLNYKNEEGNLG